MSPPAKSDRAARSVRRPAGILAVFVLTAAFYLLLIDTTDLPELYVGAVVTALATLVFEAARRQRVARMSVSPRWLSRGWRAFARIPVDVARVSLAAVEQLLAPRSRRGTLRAIPFEHGQGGRGRDAGRRALAEALGSLAPNTIVIGIDPERNLILAHQLRRSGGAEAVDVAGLS